MTLRHFKFVDDPVRYQDKKDMVAWRGVGFQPHRQKVKQRFDQFHAFSRFNFKHLMITLFADGVT